MRGKKFLKDEQTYHFRTCFINPPLSWARCMLFIIVITCIIIYYFVDIYTHCNLLEMLWTYNKQVPVFHMLHAITLRYLYIFVKVNFWEFCPPPLKKFIMIIIFNKFTKNRSWNSFNPGGTLNPSNKDLILGLANAKQTNNRNAILSIWL